jgi:predicted ATPase
MNTSTTISTFTRAFDGLMLYFPDPFEIDPRIINEKPNSKFVFIVEHVNARKKMNRVLTILQKLLKMNLQQSQLLIIKKKWIELAIMKTYYIHRFDKRNQSLFKTSNEMNAYFTLKQFIYEYEFFLKFINKRLNTR